MSWIEKTKPTPFDEQPIPGLFFLDGKQVEGHTKQDWMDGYKRPMIAFPSGEEFLLDLNDDTGEPEVYLFGEISLPLRGGPGRAYLRASEIADRAGYLVNRIDERRLVLLGEQAHERYLVSFSSDGEIEDIGSVLASYPEPVGEPDREVSLQYDMLTGELVDTRTPKQKRRDEERARLHQMEMFSARDVFQFGVKARPTLPLVNNHGQPLGMELQVQDLRSDEEKEQDIQRAAEAQTYAMFSDSRGENTHIPAGTDEPPPTAHKLVEEDQAERDAPQSVQAASPHSTRPGERVTPVYQQYDQIKQQFPNAIVFFRLGDFFETFGEDAEVIARELDIVLTSRNISKSQRIPMAGVPHHAAENYISRLIEKGYHVAVCEQVGDEPINGVMPREVVRMVAPGQPSDQPPLPGAESLSQPSPLPEKPVPTKRLTWDEFRRRALRNMQEDSEEGEWGAHEI